MSILLKELISTPLRQWDFTQLQHLPALELEHLCKILGFPHSGTKDTRITRITTLAQVAIQIQPFDPNIEESVTNEMLNAMSDRFTSKQLQDLCRQVGCYGGSTKLSRCTALIKWRRDCRNKSSELLHSLRNNLQQQRQQSQQHPRYLQLWLPLDIFTPKMPSAPPTLPPPLPTARRTTQKPRTPKPYIPWSQERKQQGHVRSLLAKLQKRHPDGGEEYFAALQDEVCRQPQYYGSCPLPGAIDACPIKLPDPEQQLCINREIEFRQQEANKARTANAKPNS